MISYASSINSSFATKPSLDRGGLSLYEQIPNVCIPIEVIENNSIQFINMIKIILHLFCIDLYQYS